MEQRINNGDIVQHFKKEIYQGNDANMYLFKVISTNARFTDTYKKAVVYEALYSTDNGVKHGDIFVREYNEFMSEVDHEKYPNIAQKYRFVVV